MKNIEIWDEYEIKARYIPVFLSSIPMVHFLMIFLGDAFWKELISNIGWMLIVANLSISFIVMLALVQFQCGLAKHWIEESVFGKGGIRFPTTEMILYSGGLISKDMKEQMRNKIFDKFGSKLSSVDEEIRDPNNARLKAREVVGLVRNSIRESILVFQYNIRYGFFRNLIGGVIWSSFGSTGCAIIYGLGNNWKAMSFFAVCLIAHISLYIFKKAVLEKLAFSYADSLFVEFLRTKKGVYDE